MQNGGALSGIKVVDLSRLLPGPYCSMILADHGAEVIAVENKRFKADNLFLTTVNRNKKHITLNVKSEKGLEIFNRLVRNADVLIEGFRPGVVKRLGIDYNTIKKFNPRIIYCAITGFGQSGPCRNMAGHDVNYLARAGVLDLIGRPNEPPTIPGIQIADIAAGGMNAAIGILLALHVREKTDQGQYIDISMSDGALSLLTLPLYFKGKTGRSPKRGDALLSHRYACYNTYTTADGRHIAIGAVENRFWKQLCEHVGKPEFTPLQYDEKQREVLIEFMRTTFRQKTLAEWEKELAQVDYCWAPCRNLDEAIDDPLFIERDMVVAMKDEKGKVHRSIGIPVKLADTPGSVRTAPVGFGESTAEVLKELGYSDKDIRVFAEEQVI
jgi:crotonobetainyl-CoA:carnitine CoA-transferase CaiB-like acyl-CoA transferase